MLATQRPGLTSGWVFTDEDGGLLPSVDTSKPASR
jgi:hypothetical protein